MNDDVYDIEDKEVIMKNFGGVMGIVGIVGLIGYGIFLTKTAFPLWAIFGLICFVSYFPWEKSQKEKNNK